MSSPGDQNEGIEQPKQSSLCANNCGFFANEACMGLCSKCHQEKMKREQEDALLLTETPSKTQIPLPKHPSILEESKTSISRTPANAPPSRIKRIRCAECNKRVGLNGFKCKCGSVFCGDHRHPGGHCCKYDHKGTEREYLARQNPVIQGEKLDRLL
eukprot:g6742.t1